MKSAKYAVHTESSTQYLLKFEDDKFYYNGTECSNGNEAMQLFLANNHVDVQSADNNDSENEETIEFIENPNITDVVKYVDSNQSLDSDTLKSYADSRGLVCELSDLGWGGGNHTYKVYDKSNSMDYVSVYFVNKAHA